MKSLKLVSGFGRKLVNGMVLFIWMMMLKDNSVHSQEKPTPSETPTSVEVCESKKEHCGSQPLDIPILLDFHFDHFVPGPQS